jgi:hypothetical protein
MSEDDSADAPDAPDASDTNDTSDTTRPDTDGDEPPGRIERAVLVGGDAEGLAAALSGYGVTVTAAEGTGTRDALVEAGVERADLLVVTDVGLSTSIPVAQELNPDLRVAVYARDSVPEFARTVADLIVDPALIDPGTVAEELVGAGE